MSVLAVQTRLTWVELVAVTDTSVGTDGGWVSPPGAELTVVVTEAAVEPELFDAVKVYVVV